MRDGKTIWKSSICVAMGCRSQRDNENIPNIVWLLTMAHLRCIKLGCQWLPLQSPWGVISRYTWGCFPFGISLGEIVVRGNPNRNFGYPEFWEVPVLVTISRFDGWHFVELLVNVLMLIGRCSYMAGLNQWWVAGVTVVQQPLEKCLQFNYWIISRFNHELACLDYFQGTVVMSWNPNQQESAQLDRGELLTARSSWCFAHGQ